MCGNCKFSIYQNGEYICTNVESDGYGLETSYDEECEEYEEKEE